MQKKVIGRKDKIDLPEFGLENVSVKIDSGAYSCSIHCEFIQEVNEDDGSKTLKVVFLDETLPKYSGEIHEFREYSKKNVKSSTGDKQERFFIKTKMVLFGQEFDTDFSLTKRTGLKNPILIGRKILNGNFLVDTALVNQSYKVKKSAAAM
ncbi:MAG: ATP-dependent zinc protease [Bacteroidota bacterium]